MHIAAIIVLFSYRKRLAWLLSQFLLHTVLCSAQQMCHSESIFKRWTLIYLYKAAPVIIFTSRYATIRHDTADVPVYTHSHVDLVKSEWCQDTSVQNTLDEREEEHITWK